MDRNKLRIIDIARDCAGVSKGQVYAPHEGSFKFRDKSEGRELLARLLDQEEERVRGAQDSAGAYLR